jgi:hypothetical protein
MRKYCGMQEGLNALSDGRLNESDPNSEFAFPNVDLLSIR